MKQALKEMREIAKDTSLNADTREEAKNDIPQAQIDLREQQARVNMLQSEYHKVYGAVERYTAKLAEAETKLSSQKQRAGELQQQIDKANTPIGKLKAGFESAGNSVEKFNNRILRLAKRVFVFSLITMALRGLRTWLGNVISTNDEAAAALGRLKGALLTMVQPLLNVIIPAFITLVNIITKVISVIASLIAMLFGTTIKNSAKSAKALNKQAGAISGVGGAAEDASKQLASFDTINKLDDNAGGGGGGGGGGAGNGIQADFDFLDDANEKAHDLLVLVLAIAAGIAAWKLGKKLGLDLKQLIGLAVAVAGAVELVYELFNMWNNGVDFSSLNKALLALAAVIGGLFIAFGTTAAAIAMVVGGLALLAVGFHDAFENGLNLENTMAIITGLVTAGLGLSILTGSFIPALIAGFAAIILVLAEVTGHGGELINGLKKICSGFLDFFKGVFTEDMALAADGINKIIDGIKETFNAIIDSVTDGINGFLDWLDEKTNGTLSPLIDLVKGIIDEIGTTVEDVFGGIIDFLTDVFEGDWDSAWEDIKGIFKSVWNGMVGIVEKVVNAIIKGINFVIKGMNKLSFDIPDWVPGVGGKKFGISINEIQPVSLVPKLAQGAVIPPNREFAAILGDQKSGTNIEAPLKTIEEALENVFSRRAYGGGTRQPIILQIDGREFASLIVDLYEGETGRRGVSLGGAVR